MKLRHQHRLTIAEAQLAQLEDKLGKTAELAQRRNDGLDTTLTQLERRLEQLEAEQHGHCNHCGRTTDYPTINYCSQHQ